MKLELKHLAPYLPYGLKIKGNTHGEVAELSCVTETSMNIKDRNFIYGMWADIFEIKPILRPLSDLTREIEHNGVKLFVMSTIESETDNCKFIKAILSNDGKWISMVFDADYDADYGINTNPEYMHWKCVKRLFEYHFDVFGLIDKGLAIDINTLK